MTPRHKVQWLDSSDTPERLLAAAGASKRAFLPVMRGDTDEVLGVVDLRELLWRYQKTGRFSLEASVIPVPMVFEHTGLPDVLDAFRQRPAPMGIVLDEYGSAVGVVTPMDILSAIAGHMGEVASEPEAFRQPDGSWLLPGRMAVDEGLHSLGIQPEEELSCATMAGFRWTVCASIRFGSIRSVPRRRRKRDRFPASGSRPRHALDFFTESV